MKAYKVVLTPDEEGYWMAAVPAVQGCRTQAKSIVMARRRIRDALSLFVEDAEKTRLDFEVNLPGEARRTLAEWQREAKEATAHQERAREAAQRFVQYTTKRLHIPVREIAEMMGISHQRVDQIAKPLKRRRSA